MTIRQLIKQILLSATGVTLKHGVASWNNLAADEVGAEAVFLVDPLKFNITDTTFMRENYPIVMLFLRKTELDASPAELEVVTEYTRQLARAFITECRDSTQLVKSITNINAVEVLHLFDAGLSGHMLSFNLEPLNNGPAC